MEGIKIEEEEIKGEKENKIETIEGLTEEEKRKKRMETKLYISRDIEGKPNREELMVIRKIEERLSHYSAFIGIGLFGSTVSGYSRDPGLYEYDNSTDQVIQSDLDIIVFYNYDLNESFQKNIIERDINDYYSHYLKHGKKMHIIFKGFPINEIKREINDFKIEGLYNFNFSVSSTRDFVINATTSISGNRIEEYREIIREQLEKLPDFSKQVVVENILTELSREDINSMRKRRIRMPELTEEDHRKILEKREEMWRKRIKKIWGI